MMARNIKIRVRCWGSRVEYSILGDPEVIPNSVQKRTEADAKEGEYRSDW